MQKLLSLYDGLTDRLRGASDLLWPLLIRLILFWEFWESGYIQKYKALYGDSDTARENYIAWFSSLEFPLPFSYLSGSANAYLACWSEMIFAILLLLGLFTRFTAVSLIVITSVAVAAAHWPETFVLSTIWDSYSISKSDDSGNYKLALLFILLLIPLVFHGGGKLSIDNLLLKLTNRNTKPHGTLDALTYAIPFAGLAVALIWVMPKTGISLFIIAAGLAGYGLTRK